MWMEEHGRERVNEVRVKEAIATGADAACTACPFCLQMFDAGVGSVQMERSEAARLQVLDIVEFLDVAVRPPGGDAVDAAADAAIDAEAEA